MTSVLKEGGNKAAACVVRQIRDELILTAPNVRTFSLVLVNIRQCMLGAMHEAECTVLLSGHPHDRAQYEHSEPMVNTPTRAAESCYLIKTRFYFLPYSISFQVNSAAYITITLQNPE